MTVNYLKIKYIVILCNLIKLTLYLIKLGVFYNDKNIENITYYTITPKYFQYNTKLQ